jgi:hypothetical protein
MNQIVEQERKVRELAAQLAAARPMRKGWVGARRMKCGKADCPCQQDEAARHGPYFTLTSRGAGHEKTKTQYLSPEAAALAREQVAAMKEFRQTVKELMAAAERWADQQLAQVSAGEAKKKGSQRR